MKALEIREKLEKALAEIAKKEKTLEKDQKKAEKISAEIKNRGWDLAAGRYQKQDTQEHQDCYWKFCDYDDAVDGIDRAEKAIAEKRVTAAKWAAKLAEAEKQERIIENQFPEVFREYQNEIIADWDEYDRRTQERLRKEYAELGFKEFTKKYSYSMVEFLKMGKDEVHRENEKQAEKLIMNLWKRNKEIVCEATEYRLYITRGNSFEGAVINGTVIGTRKNARVETIGAGGYNIQRFHYRTLVHEI